MRAIPTLLVLLVLAPVASAIDPRKGVDAGPCAASQTTGVDNWFTTVSCDGVLYLRAGDGFAGPMCQLRVLGDAYPCAL